MVEQLEIEGMTPKQSILGTKDVAHILDMSPDDVIELARNEKLKATKQGRFWRFNLADVEEYKQQNSDQS